MSAALHYHHYSYINTLYAPFLPPQQPFLCVFTAFSLSPYDFSICPPSQVIYLLPSPIFVPLSSLSFFILRCPHISSCQNSHSLPRFTYILPSQCCISMSPYRLPSSCCHITLPLHLPNPPSPQSPFCLYSSRAGETNREQALMWLQFLGPMVGLCALGRVVFQVYPDRLWG